MNTISFEAASFRSMTKAHLKPGTETITDYMLVVPEYECARALSLGAVETSRGWRFSGVQRAAWFRGEGV
jgi:hypothetical protein